MVEIARITLLTVAMATAATIIKLPLGLLLAWLLARGRFPGRVAARDSRVPSARDAAGRDRLAPADAAGAARSSGGSARSARHRGRLHVEGGGDRDGGDGPAAAGPHRSRGLRAGGSALRVGRGHARRQSAAGVPDGHAAARAAGGRGRRRPRLRACRSASSARR